MKRKFPLVSLVIGGLVTVANLASAQTWTPTSAPPQYWTAIASSADGLKLVAGGFEIQRSYMDLIPVPSPIFTSTDAGATWKQTSSPFGYWHSIACSADGGKLVAADGGDDGTEGFYAYGFVHPHGHGLIYISTNSGASWTQAGALTNVWSSVASSADGTKLVAAADIWDYPAGDGLIYTSTNSGLTWMPTSAPSNWWSYVASSADGVKLVASAQGTYDTNGVFIGQGIYTSTNSGVTWTQTTAPNGSWSMEQLLWERAIDSILGLIPASGIVVTCQPNPGVRWLFHQTEARL